MRIVHATDTYGPTVGGIEVLVRDLAARQAAAGHDVSVLTRTPGPSPDPLAPVRVCRDPEAMLDLVAAADVVHSHVSAYSPLALRTAEAAAAAGVPAVVVVHSMWSAGWPVARAACLARGWGGSPIQWAAVSEAAAGPVRRAMRGRSVLVLPNAVDVERWNTLERLPSGDPVTIVSVMRMTRRKRVMPLLKILRRVRDSVPADVPLRAVLIGEGPLHGSVVRAISRLGMESWVTAPGHLDHAGIADLYREADVFVAPATLESFGIAALEARAAGLAVVARAGTGVVDFVTHGTHGLVASSDTTMADQLSSLCKDRALLKSIMDHNKANLPPYDWSDVMWRSTFAYDLAAEGALGADESLVSQVSLSGGRPDSGG